MAESASDWNQRYLQGDTPWDKGEAAPALAELLENGDFSNNMKVLVPGCGYGHDVAAIAKAGCKAVGLDISESAVAGAKLANPGEGISYVVADFFYPVNGEEGRYDAIWEHTCFCAIQPGQRDAYVDAAYRLLKPGGVLFGVFFAFSDEPDADGPPFKTDIETIHHHFVRRFTLGWERRPARAFPTREGQEWLMCWRRR
ncbi:MAG: methyltransferase domain-containing protein [Akkermansiaceae bacterium]|nr:methyltransferase domain-containing protein [Akkermansiaceae bacterium]